MENNDKILLKSMEEVMHNSIMPYAEYVILERSLPRVEDGLKPVQRRILFAMNDLGITPDKPHKKSARIVGETLGKYHPHGDTSVYDAMVRMAQPYNMGATLIDGHGNFGSIDGDGAAAMRYTEARLTPIAMEMLKDLDKDTVPFKFNFDDTLKEPEILPASFPNLLVNGATGIAVGLATNIPQHNLEEVINGVIAQIRNENISFETMMDIVKGPDFPTGGILYANEDIFNAYETGKGKVFIRAKIETEQLKNGKTNIVIRELPYQVNKALLLERILKLSEEKKDLFSDIADIRDESDREGMRAVIEIKKGADLNKILNALYKYSDMQVSFSINMVAIAGGKPCQMGILDINRHYIEHRRLVVTRRLEFDLEKAKSREHILKGLMIAVNDIDNVIALIKASKNPKEAKEKLMKVYDLTEIQAQAILDMRLQRLTALQIEALRKEYEDILKLIEYIESILNSKTKMNNLIIKELEEVKEKYKTERRTKIVWDENPQITIEKEQKEVVSEKTQVVFFNDGYIKRCNSFDASEENVKFSVNTLSNKKIYIFTNAGSCYYIIPNDLEISKPKDKGVLLTSLFAGVLDDERIVAVFDEIDDEKDFNFYTKNGMLKKTSCKEYDTTKSKVLAIKLGEKDEVINVEVADNNKTNLLITKNGMSIRFSNENISSIKRATAGIKAIKLSSDDSVIFACQVEEKGEVLVVSDRGYMKRTPIEEYEMQGKNGKGLKTFDFKQNKSNGYSLVFADYIEKPTEYVAVQKNGQMVKFSSDEIMYESRYSKGSNIVMVIMDNVIENVFKQQ